MPALLAATFAATAAAQQAKPIANWANLNQLVTGAEALNTLITNWQSNGLQLWTYQWLSIPCQVNKNTYTIGPTGADVTNVRPLKLMEEGCYIRDTSSGTPVDTPLIVISRTDYANFGYKPSQGTPNLRNSAAYGRWPKSKQPQRRANEPPS